MFCMNIPECEERYMVCSILSTSSRQGIEGCAPSFVEAKAPAALPYLTASGKDFPSARATAKPLTNASPAEVVSTGSIGKAGKCTISSSVINDDP